MVEGQKILSLVRLSRDGIRVSAAMRAIRMPRARQIPMVEIMLKEQMDIAPNPMMTDAPDIEMDSPAHLMASCRAASCSLPLRSSSL